MARKKTRVAYITDNAAPNVTLKKRRLGLLKKVHELSVLCDVPACAVIYGPQESNPQVWPSPEEARVLLKQFNATEGFSRTNNAMNQEKFLAKRMENLRAELDRLMAYNAQLVGDYLHLECLARRPVSELDSNEIGLIGCALARRSEAVQARLLQLSEGPGDVALTPSPPILLPPPVILLPLADEGFKQADEPMAEAAPTQCGSEESQSGSGETVQPGCDLLDFCEFCTWTNNGVSEQKELLPTPSQRDSACGDEVALSLESDVLDADVLFTWTDICGSEEQVLFPSLRQGDRIVSECGGGEAAPPGIGIVNVDDWKDVCWPEQEELLPTASAREAVSDNFLQPTSVWNEVWNETEIYY